MKINKAYKEYLFDYDTDIIVFEGGTGSGKSFFALEQRSPLKLITRENANMLIMRKNGNDVKFSIIQNFLNGLTSLGLVEDIHFSFNKTDRELKILFDFGDKKTKGNKVIFRGLDDNRKIKSYVGITDIILEEASDFTLDDFSEIRGRLRDSDGSIESQKQLILMMNPDDEFYWTYSIFDDLNDENKEDIEIYEYFQDDDIKEIAGKPKKWKFKTKQNVKVNDVEEEIEISYKVFRSNYEDNSMISTKLMATIEEYKKYDYQKYIRYRLGLPIQRKEKVFFDENGNPKFKIEELDLNTFDDNFKYGLDFGFSQDPTACVEIIVNKRKKILYIHRELIHATDLTNEDIANELKSKGITNQLIISDSSEPKSIQELRRFKINNIPAKKGAGSIIAGIKTMMGYEIYINPKCNNIIREFKVYSYKLDKNSKPTAQLRDKDNHFIDAIRYALSVEASSFY